MIAIDEKLNKSIQTNIIETNKKLNEKIEKPLTHVPICQHLLNNFNIVQFNNYVYPRLFFNEDTLKNDVGYFIKNDKLENQLLIFQKYIEANKLTLSKILPNLFCNISMYKIFSSRSSILNNSNIYYSILNNHNLFFYYNQNQKNFNINKEKKLIIDNNISTSEISIEKNDNIEKEKKKTFIRRGRKTTNRNTYKIHTSLCVDNITRKIQVNYLSFVIYFANDIVRTILPPEKVIELKFKHIEYSIKRCINLLSLNEMRSKTMGEILQMKETNKSTAKSLSNKEKYLAICSFHNEIINSFFRKSYVYIFENYYLKLNNIKYFEGVKIKLSLKTKKFTYEYLENDIGLSKEKVNVIIRKYFIYGHRKYKNKFYIRKES